MSTAWSAVAELVDEVADRGIAPSAALVVGRGDAVVFERYAGTLPAAGDRGARPTDADTVYDLSSLTKPLATVVLSMLAAERGRLRLDEPVASALPHDFAPGGFAAGDPVRAGVTVRDLLAHASGLPAHRRYFETLAAEQTASGRALLATPAGRRRIEELAAAEPLEREPRRAAVYSDVGFMILGSLVEAAVGARLDRAFAEEIAAPLALRRTGFAELGEPRPSWAGEAAPCGVCAWRGGRVRGEVQDENAWAMGGVAGHAGLFAPARSVHRLAAEHVRAWRGERALFASDTLRAFWRTDARTPGSTWAHGWDTPSPAASSAGAHIGRPAVGHLGFTGTSLWIDLERGVHVVLLTNRLEVARDNTAIRAFRPRLHDAVFEAVDASR